MNPLRSLSAKLVLAFVLVAVVAVGVVAWLANRTTTREFQLYISQGKQQRAERLAPEFAAYYARSGGWVGADEWVAGLAQAQASGAGQGQGRGLGRGRGLSEERVVLADAGGLVLADSQGDLLGQHLSGAEMASGTPITVGGQLVGFLLLPTSTSVHDSLENQFLDQVNRSPCSSHAWSMTSGIWPWPRQDSFSWYRAPPTWPVSCAVCCPVLNPPPQPTARF